MWYEVEHTGQSDSCVLFAEVRVPADSPWFCGHFPGEPILPGIAQLGMVFDTIARATGKRPIKSLSRVRFKQPVRPEDRLKITAAPRKDEAWSYNFRIMLEEEVVCSGVMTFRGGPPQIHSDRLSYTARPDDQKVRGSEGASIHPEGWEDERG